jgi:hypothetical protein
MWEPRRLTTLWAFTACYRDSFTLFLPFSNMCSTQADNNSRKFRLRFGCQFPWCALALSILSQSIPGKASEKQCHRVMYGYVSHSEFHHTGDHQAYSFRNLITEINSASRRSPSKLCCNRMTCKRVLSSMDYH